VDLLDILSKGGNPHDVMVHLPKLFDAIKTLEFEKEGPPTTRANSCMAHGPSTARNGFRVI